MDESLRDLNTAIRARIAKEDAFLDRVTAEFNRIKDEMVQLASNSPDAQRILGPIIPQIAAATDLLNNTKSFGTGVNSDPDALWNNVTSALSGRPRGPAPPASGPAPGSGPAPPASGGPPPYASASSVVAPASGSGSGSSVASAPGFFSRLGFGSSGGSRKGGWISKSTRKSKRHRRSTRRPKPF